MRRKMLVGLVAMLAILGLPSPAFAGSGSGAFTFDASPEPVKKGGYVTLSGTNPVVPRATATPKRSP